MSQVNVPARAYARDVVTTFKPSTTLVIELDFLQQSITPTLPNEQSNQAPLGQQGWPTNVASVLTNLPLSAIEVYTGGAPFRTLQVSAATAKITDPLGNVTTYNLTPMTDDLTANLNTPKSIIHMPGQYTVVIEFDWSGIQYVSSTTTFTVNQLPYA